MSTHAIDDDVARAALRLARPRTRLALGLKRLADVLLALLMLVALLPILVAVVALLAFAGDAWTERLPRAGRGGRTFAVTRFAPLPGRVGVALERIGARDLPLLLAVLRGRLSFVGPRALPRPEGIGPRQLMAPGLLGPAQCRGAEHAEADALDDAYVAHWSLWTDAKLLAGRPPRRARRRVAG